MAALVERNAWSPATFQDGKRSNKTVQSVGLLCLDIDEGMTLEQAEACLVSQGFAYILGTSRSHQQPKGDQPACDRFRIIIPLDRPVTSDAEFKTVFRAAKILFPAADEACKDAARFYYPCTETVVKTQGKAFTVPDEQASPSPAVTAPSSITPAGLGELSYRTRYFLLRGAAPGKWHGELFKAAIDFKEQGYDEAAAAAALQSASTYSPKQLDEHDLRLIADVYQNRATKYGPRLATGQDGGVAASLQPLAVKAADYYDAMVAYLSDKEKVRGLPTLFDGLDKLLGGGKRTGEITVTHAAAKTGKNTLWHALMYRWLEAGIQVGYASRELTPESEVIPNLMSLKFHENAWTAEMTEERRSKYRDTLKSWQLYFAAGYGCFPLVDLTRWVEELHAIGVRYFWVDHLHYLLEDPEDHKYASKFIKELKALAKRKDVHIDLVVQPNKIQDGQRLSLDTIKGGAAIGQALDNLITLERIVGQKGVMRLALEVGRHKLARPGEIYLQYDPETTDFAECEKVEEPQSTALSKLITPVKAPALL